MKLVADSLVLYKTHPAKVLVVGEKIEIALIDRQIKKVRPKDLQVLHPGPIQDLADLIPLDGEVEEAWLLLEGSNTNLVELAELIYTTFTPSSAWAAWQLVADGLYFTGTPEIIQANRREVVEQIQREREEREAARRDWVEFIARLQNASVLPADCERLGEVERLARGQTEHSRILEALGHHQTKDSAHRFLLNLGYWTHHHNPYPMRCKVNMEVPQQATPKLPEELRRDLSYLPAYAIDNEGSQDPDDAISLEGNCLWVHVADVAALVTPDSALDQEARLRGANLYIPESITPILPPGITHALGLGLQPLSPALSFGIHLDATDADNIEICPSWVRVQRISYQEAQQRLDQEPFASLLRHMTVFRASRQARGSANIELPEVDLKLVDGALHIYLQQPLPSRELVME